MSFEARKLEFFLQILEFFPRALEFIQKPRSFEDLEFFERMPVFGGKSGKNAPNMAFFGALRTNRSIFAHLQQKC